MKYLLSLVFTLSLNTLAAPNSIIAVVNDELITFNAINQDIKPNSTKEYKMQLVDHQIDLALQLQEIKKIGIEPKVTSINASLSDIASKNKLTLAQLQSLDQFDEIVQDITDQLSLIGLKQYIAQKADTHLTAAEIEVELAKKPNGSNDLKKQVKIAQIAISSIDQTNSVLQSQDDLIKQFLIDLSHKIEKGTSFSDLAKLHSQDSSYKDGGESGWLMTDDLPAVFKKEIDKLTKDVLSKPFKAGKGWRIIKIIDTRKIDIRIRIIKAKLIKAKQNTYFKDWVKTLRKDAYIEIFDHKL